MLFIVDGLREFLSGDKNFTSEPFFSKVNSSRVKIRKFDRNHFLNLPVIPVRFAQKNCQRRITSWNYIYTYGCIKND